MYIVYLLPGLIFALTLGGAFYLLSFIFIRKKVEPQVDDNNEGMLSFLKNKQNRTFFEFIAVLLWIMMGWMLISVYYKIDLAQPKHKTKFEDTMHVTPHNHKTHKNL